MHGGLSADDQDEALKEVSRRRVILATNIAETSLTVPGVRAVVDSGLHKVARYDPARAIDSLQIERITQDSADQRAGRAGRVAAGAVWRLWDAVGPVAAPRPGRDSPHRSRGRGPRGAVVGWRSVQPRLVRSAGPLLARRRVRAAARPGRRERLAHHRDGHVDAAPAAPSAARADPAGRRRRRRSGAGVRRAVGAPLRERREPSHVQRSADDRREPRGAARSHHSCRPAALVAGGRAALQHRRARLSARAVCRITRTASRAGVPRDRRRRCSRRATAPTSAPRAACGTGSS